MFRQLAPVTVLVTYTQVSDISALAFCLCLEIKMEPINTTHPHFESPTYSLYILCSASYFVYIFQSNYQLQ